MKKIGVLTSGGDSPGMNAAVVSVARSAALYGMTLVGINRGYNGLLRKSERLEDDIAELDLDTMLDIADMAGTYLRTARCTEFLDPAVRQKAVDTLNEMGIEGLVVIGGDGSFHGAMKLCELGIKCIGIPGTIDNDLPYTEMTLGYDTAVNVDITAIRAIRATSRSHDRPHVVEVMGRHCGDIALSAAVSTGSEIVVVPEMPWSIHEVADRLKMMIDKGNTRATVVIAEGCWDSMEPFDMEKYLADNGKPCYPGEKIDCHRLAQILRYMTDTEVRNTVIGYTQRGGAPTARDSTFAFESGNMAVQLLRDGVSNQVIGRRRGQVFHEPIAEALSEKRLFNERLYRLVNTL